MINTKLVRAASKRVNHKLVSLLRKNSSRRFTENNLNQREYRVLTAGEDGCIYFWNIRAGYNEHDLSKVENVGEA